LYLYVVFNHYSSQNSTPSTTPSTTLAISAREPKLFLILRAMNCMASLLVRCRVPPSRMCCIYNESDKRMNSISSENVSKMNSISSKRSLQSVQRDNYNI
jgi:hypothetical protein